MTYERAKHSPECCGRPGGKFTPGCPRCMQVQEVRRQQNKRGRLRKQKTTETT